MNDRGAAVAVQSLRTNQLLAALPPQELESLRPDLETVPLAFRQTLYEAGQPAQHVWFPHRGVASLVSMTADELPVEIATVGFEGMMGVQLLLGSPTMGTHQACAQIAGEASRMEAGARPV